MEDWFYPNGLSSLNKEITHLLTTFLFPSLFNDFHALRMYAKIDFALSCMDLLATNAQISIHRTLVRNLVKLNCS